MKKVYWSTIVIEEWTMYSAATDEGLCYIGTPNDSFEVLEQWVKKHIDQAELIERKGFFQQTEEALLKYYKGACPLFTVPLDLYGTAFQQKVWKVLQTIPYGHTLSYSEIATRIQNPRAVRAVGSAIGANPVLVFVPCHRVVAKDGKLGGFRAGIAMKERLLEIERHS